MNNQYEEGKTGETMAEKIRVNISTLSSDWTDMTNMAKQARTKFEALKSSITALHATWDGPSHDALTSQFESDADIMEQSLDTLDKFLESVKYARDEYRLCEDKVSGKIDSIRV